jgi:hypothetical protein
MGAEILITVVFIPGDFIISIRSGEHIHITVAVHILGIDAIGPFRGKFSTNNGVGKQIEPGHQVDKRKIIPSLKRT